MTQTRLKIRKLKAKIIIFIFAMATSAGILSFCFQTDFPTDTISSDRKARIYPDYSDLVVPVNIAPLNFRIEESGTDWRTRITGTNGSELVLSGQTVSIPARFWQELLKKNIGQKISFDICVQTSGQWQRYSTFSHTVSPDPVDPYVAYRLIEPGQYFGELTLNQRDLRSFEERQFFDTTGLYNTDLKNNGVCGNCHSFRNGGTDEFLFHVRFVHSGTILYRNGELDKIETRIGKSTDSATYPAWHPTSPIVVFSVNKVLQIIHSRSTKKNETFDTDSDMLMYDIEKNEMRWIFKTPNDFETFPSWSPDGKTLYYCNCTGITAEQHQMFYQISNTEKAFDPELFRAFRYNLWKVPFDPSRLEFGKPELVIDAASKGRSIVYPSVSPDGKYLIYTEAEFGTFPLMHRESELWLLDLATGEKRLLSEINSNYAETWHNWDSSGKWLVFSSRREDGWFTRLFFTHLDENGHFSKPFILPQKDPEENLARMKSYNVPEWQTAPIQISLGKIMRRIEDPKITVPTFKE